LTHTSGLPAAFGPHDAWGFTAPAPLEEYLAAHLEVATPPAERVVYSNLAYTLVAYLVERMAEQPYREYVREHVFGPLRMTSTAFVLRPAMEERLAIPYLYDTRSDEHRPARRLKADVWPAGIVYGTVTDLAHWLVASLNGGVFEGRRVLREDLVDESMRTQLDVLRGPVSGLWGGPEAGYGLTWWTDVRDADVHFAHSGSVPGYTAFVHGNRTRRHGVAILTNGNRVHRHLVRLAAATLEAIARHETAPPVSPPAGRPR